MSKNDNATIKIINYLIAGMIIITPLLLRLYEYNAGIYDYAWMSDNGSSIDIFLHCKMIFFIVCCCMLTLLFFVQAANKNIHLSLPMEFFLLAAYVLLVTLSTLTSEYNRFSFSGIFEQFESFWCLIGYVVVVVILYLTVTTPRQYLFLTKAFIIGAAIIGVIGTSQFFGFDLNMTALGKHLIAPSAYDSLHLAFDRGMVYATLYNPDYVGLYAALLVPILFASVKILEKKGWKVLAVTDVVLLFISVVGAEAASGIISFWVSVICYLLINIKKIASNKKILFLAAIAVIAGMFATTGLSKLSWYLRKNVFSTQASIEQPAEEDISEIPTESDAVHELPAGVKTLLNSVTETDEYVEFDYNGSVFREYLYVEGNAAKICFTDENENILDYTYDDGSQYYTLTDEKYNGIRSVTCSIGEDYIGFITEVDGKEWTFGYGMGPDEKVSYYIYTNFGKFDKSVASESAVIPESQWGMLNGRGFIWAKTFGLLKRHLILGTGADSFTLAFPHNDYVAMYKSGYYENMLISKPHCLYLQCAAQTGVLSLVCLLLFYLIYFLKNCKRILTGKSEDAMSVLQNAFLAGTIGFLVSSLVNDSTICVTPVFAVILGLGIALNRVNVQKEK